MPAPQHVLTASYEVENALRRAVDHLAAFQTSGHAFLLLYSALDTRLCIERTLFEYLVLIKRSDIAGEIERLYRAKDLKRAILKAEPLFARKIEFMDLFVRFTTYDTGFVIPDLDLLAACYGRVNAYLHAPKRPHETWETPAWWDALAASLDQATRHLVEIHSGLMGGIDLTAKGRDLFDRFVKGEISRDEAIAEIEKGLRDSPLRKSS